VVTVQQNAAEVWGVPRSSILPPRLGARGMIGLSQGSFMPDWCDRPDEQGGGIREFAKDSNRGGFETLPHEDITGDALLLQAVGGQNLGGILQMLLEPLLGV